MREGERADHQSESVPCAVLPDEQDACHNGQEPNHATQEKSHKENAWINPTLDDQHHRIDQCIESIAALENEESPQHPNSCCAGHMRLIGLACECCLDHSTPT